MTAALAADLIVNGLALAALAAAILAMHGGEGPGPVERRLRALYFAIALLLALRGLAWTWPNPLLTIPVLAAAAWIPLLALRLVEQLVRRHAPRPLKWLALGGAIGFTAAALLVGGFWPRGMFAALALFQIVTLGWAGRLLHNRRPGELAAAEERVADTLVLAFLLAIPLAASDFRLLLPDLPARMGGLGVLIFLVAASRLASGLAAPRLLLADLFGLLLFAALLAVGADLLVTTLPADDVVRLFVLAFACAATTLVVIRIGEARLVTRMRPSLLTAFAQLPDRAGEEMLLGAHPLLATGKLVESEALGLYDQAVVAAIARRRVVTASSSLDPEVAAAARNLLDSAAATHLVRLSQYPPRFLAVAAGELTGAGTLAAELDMLSRLAERQRS
ncbi:MAG TPA: hypothetical protein VIT45_02170 [Allosphingosinicella sp.]